MRRSLEILTLSLVILISSYSRVFAIDAPFFPSCLSPQGEVRVYYPDGTHGIVGSSDSYVGSDAVYTLTDDTIEQCFCSTDGVGIQTNWWKASSLSDEQVEVLKNEGWYYIPDGSLWGLDESPYVAQNTRYSCLSTPKPSSSSTSSSSTSSSSSNSNSNSSSSSDNNNSSSSSEGSVLGLAATGDSAVLLALFAIATTLIIAGLRQSRHEKN